MDRKGMYMHEMRSHVQFLRFRECYRNTCRHRLIILHSTLVRGSLIILDEEYNKVAM